MCSHYPHSSLPLLAARTNGVAGGGTDHQRIHCDLASHDSATPPQVLPIGADAQ